MTALNIGQIRLANQQIASHTFNQPGQVVSWLGAMQAQDYIGAKWAIGLRTPTATANDIEQAIADRIIVRTWPMRGTLHFVAAADVRWMLALLTPRIIAGSARRQQQLGLDDVIFSRCRNLFTQALQGGQRLTREEMFGVLEAAGISTESQRGYHILWRIAQEGLICFGPPQGKQQTFVLLDEWVPPTKDMLREEALAELAKRYSTGHGPATLQDFAWWSGLKVSDARTGLESVASQLTHKIIDGTTHWMSQGLPTLSDNSPTAFLLPGFDEYILGYRDRSAVLDPSHAQKICPGNNGVFMPTIIIDGRVVGTWQRVVKKNHIVITPHPFTSLDEDSSQAVAVAAASYGDFAEIPITMS